MKNPLLILLLFISIQSFSQKTSGEVTYVVSMVAFNDKKADSIYQTVNNEKKEMNNFLKEMLNNTKDVNAFLKFTKEESIYEVENKLEIDGKLTLNLTRIIAGGEDIYYKNLNNKENYYQSDVFGEMLLIEMQSRKWILTQESKIIANYLCFKAIDIESTNTKIKPLVWFTSSIPISFGPKEFSGLPGLVLEVEMFNSKIVATKIVLNPEKEITITKPVKGKKITAEEYEKMMQRLNKYSKKQ